MDVEWHYLLMPAVDFASRLIASMQELKFDDRWSGVWSLSNVGCLLISASFGGVSRVFERTEPF